MIDFTCHICGKQFSVPHAEVGKTVTCACGEVLRVAAPKPPRAATPATSVARESWEYGFVEKYAKVTRGVSLWVAGLGLLLTWGFAALALVNGGCFASLAVVIASVFWPLLYVGTCLWSAVLLVVVNIGRDLRAVQRHLTQSGRLARQ